MCLALLLGLAASYIALVHSGGAGPKRSDFVPYFSAAHLVLTGHGGEIYHFHRLGRYESALVRPLRVKDGVMPYLYPPYFAVTLAPLAALPYVAAFLLWTALNAAMLPAAIGALARYAGTRGGSALLFWCAGLSFLPVLVGLAQGQTSALLLGLLTGAFLAIRSGRPLPGGILLGCALVKPAYVLPVLGVLVLHRQWRAAMACVATGLALFALPSVLLGAAVNRGYGDTLAQASGWRHQIGGFEATWNHSLAGFTQLLFPARVATVLTGVLCLLALAGAFMAIRRSGSFDCAFALAVVLGLLLSPHVLIHDLTLLLIPAAMALRLRGYADAGTLTVLATGYVAVVAGLALVSAVPLQLSVLATSLLGLWIGAFMWKGVNGETREGMPAPGNNQAFVKDEAYAG